MSYTPREVFITKYTTGILAENKIIEVKDAYKKVKAELLGGRLMDAQEALVSKKLRTTH
jgi:hypothetical protein